MVSFGVELSALFRVEEQSAPTVVLKTIEAVESRGMYVYSTIAFTVQAVALFLCFNL